jgi:hypothetical protein
MIEPKLGSIEAAQSEMWFPDATVDDAHALELAKFIIFYICWNLDWTAKGDSVEHALARVGFTFLERLPLLVALSAVEDRLS